MTIEELIELMKREGSQLAKPVPVEGIPDMAFDCTFADTGESELAVPESIPAYPTDLVDFWKIARSAKLFEDKSYGQWGLEILDPSSAAMATGKLRDRRFRDYVLGDLVIGRFLGDSDLLVIRCDPSSSDFGNVLVAPPVDPRHEWYQVAESLAAFLDMFIRSGGDKLWTAT